MYLYRFGTMFTMLVYNFQFTYLHSAFFTIHWVWLWAKLLPLNIAKTFSLNWSLFLHSACGQLPASFPFGRCIKAGCVWYTNSPSHTISTQFLSMNRHVFFKSFVNCRLVLHLKKRSEAIHQKRKSKDLPQGVKANQHAR